MAIALKAVAIAVAVCFQALSVTGISYAQSAEIYKGEKVVQVLGANTDAGVQVVEDSVTEVLIYNYSKGGMTVRANKGQVSALKDLGFEVNVVLDDLAEHLTKALDGALDDDKSYRVQNVTDIGDSYYEKYHDYLTIGNYLDQVVAINVSAGVNQTWLTKKVLGTTLEQRPIWAIEIGNPDAPEAIYIEGGIHAREWVTVTSLQYMVKEYALMYASGNNATLFDQFKFYFVPLVNPDGYRHSYLFERLWRKNRRVTLNDTCLGVNLNRNYNGFDSWQFEPDVCSTNYAGLNPYSEPETKALVKYHNSIKAKHQVLAALDIHSYDQSLLYPYGYGWSLPDAPNKDALVECAKKMSEAMEASSGKVYQVKNAGASYPGYGCADDYYYDQFASGPWTDNKGIVYTVEMRPTEDDPIGFVLPPEQILSAAKEMYAGIGALVDFVKTAVDNVQ